LEWDRDLLLRRGHVGRSEVLAIRVKKMISAPVSVMHS
jgi:hypothetical protein